MKANTWSIEDTQFSWVLDKAIADLRPVMIAENILLSYAGSYPPFEISYESGHLIFTSGTTKLEMIPLDKNTFMLKEADYLRIQIIGENGNIIALKGIWNDGRTKIYQKAK